MVTMRMVVIGADAAGMSAAHQALRTAQAAQVGLDVVVLEAGEWTSYSACGIPYRVAGDVDAIEDLVARTPAQHREAGIDLRMGTRVVSVDPDARTVTTETGEELAYDHLVVATGGEPIVPDWARTETGLVGGVGVAKTLDDAETWRALIAEAGEGASMVVCGGGYIGVEMAEAGLRAGLRVTVLTRSRVMSQLDEEMSALVVEALREAGAEVVEGAEVTGLRTTEDARVRAVCTPGGDYAAALVVVALGLRPRFPDGLDLPTGASGGLLPEPSGRVADRIWAAGDCCEVAHRVTGGTAYLPLGTHANKAGRVIGSQVGAAAAGTTAPEDEVCTGFPGALGTAITRVQAGETDVEIAMTGLSEAAARDAGFDPIAVTTQGSTASGYMPEAEPLSIRVVADRTDRRLLGVQIVGGRNAGKRIDAAAMCLWARGSVDDLAWADLSYAPPFATAWEVLSIAARRVAERL